jgi:hypothetical protein
VSAGFKFGGTAPVRLRFVASGLMENVRWIAMGSPSRLIELAAQVDPALKTPLD